MSDKKLLNEEELDNVAGGAGGNEIKLPCQYTVQSGDNLWTIAQKFYGKGIMNQKIYNANKAVIGDNPDLIRPGMVLTIPA
ncbi:MAG: LysM peptidoglycan-binding domain-containing protein [Clostridia bacterium]|nr:LysM peptidoglycan-binding domain-containing protein [Clostridia bacterium]